MVKLRLLRSKEMFLYHQHLIPYLPTKTLSTMWASLIRTFKNWETLKSKYYPHTYSYERLWAYALLVSSELTLRGKQPNTDYLETARLGTNLCSQYFDYRILYKNAIDDALKRTVVFYSHNNYYLEQCIEKLIGANKEPYRYEKSWVSWSMEYAADKFRPVLCNGNYYGILKTNPAYSIGDPDFLK